MENLPPGADPARARRDALDELFRPGPRRRPLFRRDLHGADGSTPPVPAGDLPSAPSDERSGDATPAPVTGTGAVPAVGGPVRVSRVAHRRGPGVPDLLIRPPAWLVVVAVVVVAVAGWWWMRRPAPAEDRLPRAVASAGIGPAPSSVTAAGSGTTGSPVPAGPGDPSAVGSSAMAAAGGPVTVHVAGAVVRPGVVTVSDGGRVVDAVQAAGGMAAGADPDRVNLAARLVDGERVLVPFVGQPAPAAVAVGAPAATAAADAGGSGAPVDLNRATAEELDALPGVGPSTAAAIISHRESEGPFRTVEDLLDVRGIGDARLENLRPLVTVG